MLAAVISYLRRHHVGLIALCIALTGTAYAATLPRNSVGPAQLKKNAVTSPKVKPGSLLLKDFKASQRDRLEGPQGPQGPPGAQGAQGAQGPQGPQGAAGATNVIVRVGPTTVGTSTAICEGAERAVGGGGFAGETDAFLYNSAPIEIGDTPKAWEASAQTTAGADAQVDAFVVCASP